MKVRFKDKENRQKGRIEYKPVIFLACRPVFCFCSFAPRVFMHVYPSRDTQFWVWLIELKLNGVCAFKNC